MYTCFFIAAGILVLLFFALKLSRRIPKRYNTFIDFFGVMVATVIGVFLGIFFSELAAKENEKEKVISLFQIIQKEMEIQMYICKHIRSDIASEPDNGDSMIKYLKGKLSRNPITLSELLNIELILNNISAKTFSLLYIANENIMSNRFNLVQSEITKQKVMYYIASYKIEVEHVRFVANREIEFLNGNIDEKTLAYYLQYSSKIKKEIYAADLPLDSVMKSIFFPMRHYEYTAHYWIGSFNSKKGSKWEERIEPIYDSSEFNKY